MDGVDEERVGSWDSMFCRSVRTGWSCLSLGVFSSLFLPPFLALAFVSTVAWTPSRLLTVLWKNLKGVKQGRFSVFRVNQRTINIADISTMKPMALLWHQNTHKWSVTLYNCNYTKQILQHSSTITDNAIKKTFFNIVSAANLWHHLWKLSKTCTEDNNFPLQI